MGSQALARVLFVLESRSLPLVVLISFDVNVLRRGVKRVRTTTGSVRRLQENRRKMPTAPYEPGFRGKSRWAALIGATVCLGVAGLALGIGLAREEPEAARPELAEVSRIGQNGTSRNGDNQNAEEQNGEELLPRDVPVPPIPEPPRATELAPVLPDASLSDEELFADAMPISGEAGAGGTTEGGEGGAPAADVSAAGTGGAATSEEVPVEQAGPVCGPTACQVGQVCCNESCGYCVQPGETCSQFACGQPATPFSAYCGPATCNVGEVCCNASCGTCVNPGETCDQASCGRQPQDAVSYMCGMATCNVGLVCCNPSCGICAPPGVPCSHEVCD